MAFKLHKKAKVKGKIEIDDKKVLTGEFRLSYPSLFKQRVYKGKEVGYGTSMLFSKDDDISDLEIAAHNAAIEKWGSDTTKWPSKKIKSKKTGKVINKCLVEMPFKDGDIEKPDKPEYENVIFVNAGNKKNAPGVVGPKKVKGVLPTLTEKDIKAGDYARASLIAFAYGEDGDANFGVAFALMNVQKLKTGEGFGGGRNAADEFDESEYDEDEDADDMEDEDGEESEDEDEDEESEDEDEDEEEDEDEDEEEKPRKSSKKTTKKKTRY
jgi:cobalamin biosynthesis protein CobT